MTDTIVLPGLDGANPLAFLATLGVLAVCGRANPGARIRWTLHGSGFRPEILGLGDDENALIETLYDALHGGAPTPFAIDARLPFATANFRSALDQAARSAATGQRHYLDLVAALGTDAYQDEKGNFADTAFRMVRSGDAAGQGLPAYALAIRKSTDRAALNRTLFRPWDYRDDGSSLRLDPLEDQRYALRWYDPSPDSNKKYALRSMRGANALAMEGIALMPVQPGMHRALTTGFHVPERRREVFTWPIWETPATVDLVRSLVALADLHTPIPARTELRSRGIVEIYRCERIAPNQYYKNFSPAVTP